MLLSILLLVIIIAIIVLLILNINIMRKSYKSQKYKLYEYLNNVFENKKQKENIKLYKYSIKNKLMYKEKRKIYLTSLGLDYIKDFNINNNTLYYTILTLILSIMSFVMSLQQQLYHR